MRVRPTRRSRACRYAIRCPTTARTARAGWSPRPSSTDTSIPPSRPLVNLLACATSVSYRILTFLPLAGDCCYCELLAALLRTLLRCVRNKLLRMLLISVCISAVAIANQSHYALACGVVCGTLLVAQASKITNTRYRVPSLSTAPRN